MDSSHISLPKLALLSDAALVGFQGGINRTLHNLFSHYPKDRFLLIAPRHECNARDDKAMKVEFLAPYDSPIPQIKTRVAKYLSGAIAKTNRALLGRGWGVPFDAIEGFKPDILLVSSSLLETIIVGNTIADRTGLPTAFYLMDDLRDLEQQWWPGGTGKSAIEHLLRRSRGRLYISEELASVYNERYSLDSAHDHIVHNPVTVEMNLDSMPLARRRFTIGYAGSIWPMHQDAIELCAEAIGILRQKEVDIELALYTSRDFWNSVESDWAPLGVTFRGFVPYESLQKELRTCDLLLAPASFRPEYEHLSRASIQTKLTDYMASGRAILSLGPTGSAAHSFVTRYNCGIALNESTAESLAVRLESLITERPQFDALGQAGYKAAASHFSQQSVSPSLYNYLNGLLTQ